MNFKPLGDRILVKRVEDVEEIQGGIVIPETAKEKPQEGEVIAVGDGRVLDSGEKIGLSVKNGDRILFGKYGGSDVTINGEEYLILREDDILGILEN